MKSCPTCNRTYADDTFTFCLDDGALLSASFDPQATLQIPAARATGQPNAENLRTPAAHVDARPAPTQKTHSTDPYSYSQGAPAGTLPEKRGGAAKLITGGVIALLSIGVLVLGYVAWRASQNPAEETAKSDANIQSNTTTNSRNTTTSTNTTSSTNANTFTANTNTNGSMNGGLPQTQSSQWLEGVWEGTGQQHAPKMTWSIKLTAENDAYLIEYPSLRCGGKWTLVEMNEGRAKFKESISRGLDKCSDGGDITLEKISDSQVSYKYTLPIIGEVATARLSKRAMP